MQSISSLHFVLELFEGRGPGRTPLDWATRLKIALGVAKALRYLHYECGKQKISHGNIKSSNILLGENHQPLVADFGLALIMNPTAATSRVAGYRAPEYADSKRISQAADVYSFGVVRLSSSSVPLVLFFAQCGQWIPEENLLLPYNSQQRDLWPFQVMLELLTGKAPAPFHPSEKGIDLPKWVQSVVREEWTAEVFDIEIMPYKDIEEDMVSMLQTAMLCTEPVPERRPKMNTVVALLEKLCRDQSQSQSCNNSMCQSPSPSEDVTASDS